MTPRTGRMKKFLFGLKHGNWLTRLYVIATPVCILAGVGLVIASFVVSSMIMFLAGVGIEIGAIVLILNVTVEEGEREPEAEPEPVQVISRRKKKTAGTEAGTPEKEHRKKAPDTDALSSTPEISEAPDKPEEAASPAAEEEPGEKEEPPEDAGKKEEELTAYNEQNIKQVFFRYKVRKDHKCIMIDEWEEKQIRQCPAYIWKYRNQLHILVIANGTQEFSLPLSKVSVLKYHRGVVCHAKEEYLQFRKESMLAAVFTPYLPSYHQGNKNGRPVVYKNLFELGNGLRITNTSVKPVLALLQPEFQIEDIVTRDIRYNAFFKEIYKKGVLFREQALSPREYQECVNEILQRLALSEVSEQEYQDTLRALRQNKLISQEYIAYYSQYRERLQAGESPGKGGKKSGRKQLKQKK